MRAARFGTSHSLGRAPFAVVVRLGVTPLNALHRRAVSPVSDFTDWQLLPMSGLHSPDVIADSARTGTNKEVIRKHLKVLLNGVSPAWKV